MATSKLRENFETTLHPLAQICNVETPTDELGKAKLIQKINEHFEADENVFPCVQFSDVSILHTEL